MAILERFSDIIKANIKVLLEKQEEIEKMIDQYLEDMMKDLAEVKQSTAEVMAEETRTKRLVEQNEAEVAKYNEFAKKALMAGNEEDAKIFINKKQELENVGAGLMTAYAAAHENAIKMRQMHDKLTADIEALRARRQVIKSKIKVAKTQETLNEATQATKKIAGAKSAFERMEATASNMREESNAMAEHNMAPIDEAKALEEKYASMGTASVDDELKKMKEELGLE